MSRSFKKHPIHRSLCRTARCGKASYNRLARRAGIQDDRPVKGNQWRNIYGDKRGRKGQWKRRSFNDFLADAQRAYTTAVEVVEADFQRWHWFADDYVYRDWRTGETKCRPAGWYENTNYVERQHRVYDAGPPNIRRVWSDYCKQYRRK